MPVEPFVGQVMLTAFNFAPVGYAFCDGRILNISQNTALFALLGTTYGGDGLTTFALPNLQGRVPLHAGQGAGLSNYDMGQESGAESVTLAVTELPAHSHALDTSAMTATLRCRNEEGNQQSPSGGVPAIESAGVTATYSDAAPSASMRAGAVTVTGAMTMGTAGQSAAHENRQPFLVLRYCIATQGIFPSQS